MTIFEKRQLEIAKKTLKMNDAIVNVMEGMTKEEANKIIKQHMILTEKGDKLK